MKASREEKVESQIIQNLQSTTEVLSLAQMGNINLPLVIKSGAAINPCWRFASSKSKSQLIMNGPLLTEGEENRAPSFVQIMEGGKDIYKKDYKPKSSEAYRRIASENATKDLCSAKSQNI